MNATLRHARLCYDHVAGEIGVGLTACLVDGGFLTLAHHDAHVTASGVEFLSGFGIDLALARKQRRNYCKACLDWTEKRNHLAGAVGAALTKRLFDLKWIERSPHGRTLIVTSDGYEGFRRVFSLELKAPVTQREMMPADLGA